MQLCSLIEQNFKQFEFKQLLIASIGKFSLVFNRNSVVLLLNQAGAQYYIILIVFLFEGNDEKGMEDLLNLICPIDLDLTIVPADLDLKTHNNLLSFDSIGKCSIFSKI